MRFVLWPIQKNGCKLPVHFLVFVGRVLLWSEVCVVLCGVVWCIFGWCFLAFGRMFHLPLVMAAVATATAAVLINKDKERRRRRMMRRRRYWVHPIISNREQRGQFSILYNDLRQHEEKFFNYSRMSVNSFDELLGLLFSRLERQNTTFRNSVAPAERLLVTLRYLATGNSFASLHYEFKLGKSTVSSIVRDTCIAIWEVLRDVVMRKPTKEEWISIADLFWERCNFPNCVGAIDGKHIRIVKPLSSGTKYFNYKKYFSFVLMAVADANYSFTYIDIGSYGSSSDSSIFSHSSFGKMLREKSLDLPHERPLPGTSQPSLPFIFVGDEAFALSEHLLRPYANRSLTIEKRVFNYRLTRARRVVECTFGILANKWRFLHTAINLSMDNAIIAVKAACALHNFVRSRDGYLFEDSLMDDMEGAEWTHTRGNYRGANIREDFTNYFISPAGQVSWQLDAIQ